MNVRSAAARIIASLLAEQGSLTGLLPDYQNRIPTRDQGLLQELCYGSCRWQPRLQCYLDVLLDKPLRNKDRDIQALLLIGLYQLAYLRIPDHAAIGATVEAAQTLKKPWAKRLVNGVLRRYQREKEALTASLEQRGEFRFAHPAWLLAAIDSAWPRDSEAIFAANNLHPPLTLRVNRRRFARDDYLALLREQGVEARPTPYSADGIELQTAREVTALPHFQEGAVSVQDEAAQLCAHLLELGEGMDVLDACCAPGGKTAHILESESRLSRVIGVDISEQRLQRTRDNLTRLGLDAELIADDATRADWWHGRPGFDRILVDAPCSATGVIRRHPDIKLLRKPEHVTKLRQTQQAILNSNWSLLKPGGILLYATCSILPEENSRQVAEFLAHHADAEEQDLAVDWGIPQTHGRQLLPRPEGHDGFYFAKLRKHT